MRPPDWTESGIHTGLVVQWHNITNKYVWRSTQEELVHIFSSRTKKRTFKGKTEHRAEEAGFDGEPEVPLDTFRVKHS